MQAPAAHRTRLRARLTRLYAFTSGAVSLLPRRQRPPHLLVERDDRPLLLDGLERLEPGGVVTGAHEAGGHDGGAPPLAVGAVHHHRAVLRAAHRRLRRPLNLLRRRRHAVPARKEQVLGARVPAAFRKLAREVDRQRPLLLERDAVTAADPPPGLNLCGNTHPMLAEKDKVDRSVQPVEEVERAPDCKRPVGNLPSHVVLANETHSPSRNEKHGNDGVRDGAPQK
mmetsp:Transcript_16847/g.36196  ORF Transcript_16847/g.36196 Transcript_16847/m.36196 type:complete len:226 (-) Transcript_16847:34-711(-)